MQALGLNMYMDLSDSASVMFILTWDRANELPALFCRNMRAKIGHLKWCWFFLFSNDVIFSTNFLENIYNQEGIFRGIEFILFFKGLLFFNV